jgi:hypothetical protein
MKPPLKASLRSARPAKTTLSADALRLTSALAPHSGKDSKMRLTDLDPQFLQVETPGDRTVFRHVDSLEEADGIRFLCPLCFKNSGKREGVHGVMCFKPGVKGVVTGPGRWTMAGTDYSDLTLSPSVLLLSGCGWHGFITSGSIVTC